jgi:ribonuclease H / adenosylcobalamin/alpha-ribazole phosphatase
MNIAANTVRFFLMRHGETKDNQQMRYIGTRNVPLVESGIRQAEQAAVAFSQIHIDKIIASSRRRTIETAGIVSSACSIDLQIDDRLVEGSFGEWEGLTRDEVMHRSEEDVHILRRWEADPGCAPPGGESIVSVQKRVVGLADELLKEFQGASIILVSHVGPIKALLAAVMDIPLQASRRLFLDPASISVIDWGAHPIVRLVNSHAHLGWTNARWMQK